MFSKVEDPLVLHDTLIFVTSYLLFTFSPEISIELERKTGWCGSVLTSPKPRASLSSTLWAGLGWASLNDGAERALCWLVFSFFCLFLESLYSELVAKFPGTIAFS